MSTRMHTHVNARLYIQLIQHTKNGISLFNIRTHNIPEVPKKHTYMTPCPYNQRWQSEDTLTISYPTLRWTYMEARGTKKTFLIFLILAYVNLGSRNFIHYTDSGIRMFKKRVFSSELDYASHWMTLTNTGRFIVCMVIPPHHRARHVQNTSSSIFYTLCYIF